MQPLSFDDSIGWRQATSSVSRSRPTSRSRISPTIRPPAHLYAAKFSAQYCVARALTDGALRIADFDDERIAEPTCAT